MRSAFTSMLLLFGSLAHAQLDPDWEIVKDVTFGFEAMKLYEKYSVEEATLRGKWRRGKPFTDADYETWLKTNEEREFWKLQMERSFETAISKTMRLHKIAPSSSGGIVQNGPMKGMPAAWNPKVLYDLNPISGEPQPVYQETRSKNMIEVYKVSPFQGKGGQTTPDGQVFVTLQALETVVALSNPRILAAAIHHEQSHFEQLISAGWPTREETERKAYQDSLLAADRFLLTKEERAHFELMRSGFEAEKQKGKATDPFPNQSESEQVWKEFKLERDALQELQKNRETLKALVAERRQYREEEPKRRKAIEESQARGRWADLAKWSLTACEYLQPVQPGDPAWGDPQAIRGKEQARKDFLRENLVVVSAAEINRGLKSRDLLFPGGELAVCQERVLTMFRDLPAPIDADWMISSLEYQKRGGALGDALNRFLRNLKKAASVGWSAFVREVDRPFSGTRGSPQTKPSSREPGLGREPRDGVAQGQLRGVANGKDWR